MENQDKNGFQGVTEDVKKIREKKDLGAHKLGMNVGVKEGIKERINKSTKADKRKEGFKTLKIY